jgi:hypothetical protein
MDLFAHGVVVNLLHANLPRLVLASISNLVGCEGFVFFLHKLR